MGHVSYSRTITCITYWYLISRFGRDYNYFAGFELFDTFAISIGKYEKLFCELNFPFGY